MKFNLYLLADHIKEYHPYVLEGGGADLALRQIRIMDKNAQCREDTAYLLPWEKRDILKKQDRQASFSFVILCKEDTLEWEIGLAKLPKQWKFLVLRTKQSLKTVYQDLLGVIFLLNDWFEELAESVLCQRDLQTQMDCAVRYFKNPVALFDMSMALLAWSGPMPETTSDPVWSHVLSWGYNTLDMFPVENRRPVSEGVGEDRVVIAPPMEKRDTCHNMIATLYHKGLPFACLAMNELNQPFDNAEYSYMLIIKKLLEQSPVVLRNVVLAKDKGSKIFLRLLRGQTVEEKQLSMFLREHGWKQEDSVAVYVFRYAGNDKLNEQSYKSYMNMLQRIVPELELFYYEGSLVAVERSCSRSDSIERLQKIEEKLAIPFGASMVYQGYGHLHEAFLQAEAAWNYAKEHAGQARYEDIYPGYLLESLNRKNNLTHFCHPALFRLNREEEWDRELLHTLYVYLQNGRRVSSAAEELHIHRNTMLNRLRIIDERLGLKIDEICQQEEQLLYISCMILQRGE